jgi:hypothetical protein
MGNGWNNGAQGTGMNILMAALNMGNAGNLEKLTLGYGWNEEQLRSEVNTFMTKQDWDLVQDILDTVNSLWPDLEREAFKATGIKPPKVEAVPIETPYGEYRGATSRLPMTSTTSTTRSRCRRSPRTARLCRTSLRRAFQTA